MKRSAVWSLWLMSCVTLTAWAGGSPENALLILDPLNLDSLHVANYYKDARDLPDNNFLYMQPGAANFQEFNDVNLTGLFGYLAQARIADRIDYLVTCPGAPYFVSAGGLVTDGCAPVTRFSISGCYTLAFLAPRVQQGGLPSNELNRYSRVGSDDARFFDSSFAYLSGAPSVPPAISARRYFIGAMLGYSGERGNTIAQTLAMIDRSVAADGVRPAGSFCFMNNLADSARNVRSSQYSAVISTLNTIGRTGLFINGILPEGRSDCLGIMTGAANLPILSADYAIVPGGFCDHLTSFAATFDDGSQTKLSDWITRGASGSWGAVEEPCNGTFKFPHARMHAHYARGLSLGEAAFRSVSAIPFQGLLYGDPLTRPFAVLPTVNVADLPGGMITGSLTLTPAATTTLPGAAIASLELIVDGVSAGTIAPGGSFTLNTRTLADGRHELRVLAYDDSTVRSVGRWRGWIQTRNFGRDAALTVSAGTGTLSDAFDFTITATGPGAGAARLIHNGRVVGAAGTAPATIRLYGMSVGAGPVSVVPEVVYTDGMRVRGNAVTLEISPTAAPQAPTPTAFSYAKSISATAAAIIELPAAYDNLGADLTWEIVTPPARASFVGGASDGYRIVRPAPGACGADALTFRVRGPGGVSNVATVSLFYRCRGDVNCDGLIDFNDIDAFITALLGAEQYFVAFPGCAIELADADCNGSVDFNDIGAYVNCLTAGACPACP